MQKEGDHLFVHQIGNLKNPWCWSERRETMNRNENRFPRVGWEGVEIWQDVT